MNKGTLMALWLVVFGALIILVTRFWYSSNGLVLTLRIVPPPVTRWYITMVLSVILLASVGFAVNNRWDGFLIDERNKISLSRLQIALWTVVILSALVALVGVRAQVAANELDTNLVHVTLPSPPAPGNGGANAGNATGTANTQPAKVDPAVVTIPEELWLLMGISTTALVGSPLIRSQTQKQNKNPKLNDPQVKANITREMAAGPDTRTTVDSATTRQQILEAVKVKQRVVQGNVFGNAKPDDASWADIFRGELVSNSQLVDMAKVQNFVFTVFLVGIYIATLDQALKSATLPDTLPGMSAGMITLLGISHAGYLISKGTQQVPQETESTETAEVVGVREVSGSLDEPLG